MKDKYTGHPRGFGFIKFEDINGGAGSLFHVRLLSVLKQNDE